ncbi:MAG TPA: T9SS type A sorting domain-containing protein [Flavitalea sp.]|nr:T9SS type A sorting domain-containing protein [Flavitalea sp.]
MKCLNSIKHVVYCKVLFWLFFAGLHSPSNAQICSDPANVIYGLTNGGFIHPITVSTGVAGPALNPPYGGNVPVSSNGMGYNPFNGKFYYFKRMPGSVPQEFISFDPGTNTVTILNNCPTTNYVYVGCLNGTGTGYYCWDDNATLFYYNVALNTWTTITSDIRDQYGKDVDSLIRLHGSGDAAIDGLGNLLMLPSSITKLAVFRLNAPLPTTPQASITVRELMPLTNAPAKFGGIALNATGEIFLSATTPSNALYRLEQNNTLTFISTISIAMGDLTSCNFPFGVLASSLLNFTAVANGNQVQISFSAKTDAPEILYTVEHSSNTKEWKPIRIFNDTRIAEANQLTFIDYNPGVGKNYYRIAFSGSQNIQYSEIKTVYINSSASVFSYPNPVQNELLITRNGTTSGALKATLQDFTGRIIYQLIITQTTGRINTQHLIPGTYLLTIHSSGSRGITSKIIKQ